jgi:hypothetical protein
MYVRGKYGKSLKLDLLKKGLDQALEKTAAKARIASSPPQPAPTPPTPTVTPTNHNNRDRSPTSNAVSALLNSLSHHHNNNNKEHNNNNNSSSKSGNKMGNGGLLEGGLSQQQTSSDHNLPPPFNPFLFGDFGQASFPFASALQHIGLPPHLAMAAAHHPGLLGQGSGGPQGNPSGMFGTGGSMKVEKVGGEDEK